MCKFTNAAFNFTNNHLTAEVFGRILNEKIFTCCLFSQNVVTYYFTFVFAPETFKNYIHINIYSTMFQFYFEQSVLKLDECCSCQRNFKRSEMLRLMFCMFKKKSSIYIMQQLGTSFARVHIRNTASHLLLNCLPCFVCE